MVGECGESLSLQVHNNCGQNQPEKQQQEEIRLASGGIVNCFQPIALAPLVDCNHDAHSFFLSVGLF